MKKIIFALALFVGLFLSTTTVSAIPVLYSSGKKVEMVKEIPNLVVDDERFNLGVMYDQFSIFWIPMWNYGETKYVLFSEDKNSYTYLDLDAEDLAIIKEEFNVDFPDKPTIGFWNRIGGKLIWGLVILAAVAGWWWTRNDDDEEKEMPAQEEA